MCRRVMSSNPDFYAMHLIMALTKLAILLRHSGRHEEAITRAKEAAEVHREIGAHCGPDFSPYLGVALNDLSLLLNDLGQHEHEHEQARATA